MIIHDDVEIGANAAIDRGALGSTVIGQGTKIDNLVHIAHNVAVGRNCIIMGQAGFAGSTHLGDYCVVASQSGIAGHLKLGNQATVGAKSGVMRDVPDGGTVLGIPAAPDKQAKRQMIAVTAVAGINPSRARTGEAGGATQCQDRLIVGLVVSEWRLPMRKKLSS